MSKHIDPERSKTKHHLFRTNAAVEVLAGENVLVPSTGAKNSGTDAVAGHLGRRRRRPSGRERPGSAGRIRHLAKGHVAGGYRQGLPQTVLAAA